MIFSRRLRSLSAPKVTAWSGGVGVGILAALLALSACSDSSAAPEVTVVAAATSTTFRTEPVRTTTTTVAPPPEADDPDEAPGDHSDDASGDATADDPDAERTYRIRGGDYLVGIARQFGVTAESIVAYNGWESMQHSLQPGNDIRIPPQDWTPDDNAPGTADDDPASSAADDGAEGECPDGSAQETYTIRAGDVKGTVARRFGVTVVELDAANAGTPYYAGFVIGIEIVIPC